MTYLQIKPERNIICMFHGFTHNPTDNYESNWRLRLLIHDMVANQTRVKHHLYVPRFYTQQQTTARATSH